MDTLKGLFSQKKCIVRHHKVDYVVESIEKNYLKVTFYERQIYLTVCMIMFCWKSGMILVNLHMLQNHP